MGLLRFEQWLLLISPSLLRQKVLADASYEFSAYVPDSDESLIPREGPKEEAWNIAWNIASKKLCATKKTGIRSDHLFICIEQIAATSAGILKQPTTAAEARRFLELCQQSPVTLLNYMVVYNTRTCDKRDGSETLTLTMGEVPPQVIDEVIEQGDVLLGNPLLAPYIKSTDGAPDQLIGMPLKLFRELILGKA